MSMHGNSRDTRCHVPSNAQQVTLPSNKNLPPRAALHKPIRTSIRSKKEQEDRGHDPGQGRMMSVMNRTVFHERDKMPHQPPSAAAEHQPRATRQPLPVIYF